MRKLALRALAAAMALTPALVSTAAYASTSNTVQTGGRDVSPNGQGLGNIGTPITVSLDMQNAGSSLTANDVSFGNVTPSSTQPTVANGLLVSYVCGGGIQPIISLSSGNGCQMTNGSQNILYEVYPSTPAAGTGLCTSGSAPPSKFYQTNSGEAGSSGHYFTLQTTNLINGAGQAIYEPGHYSDTLNVYLEF